MSKIKVAANLVTGRYLQNLYKIAEKQKSVSCTVLNSYLDQAHEAMKRDAIKLRDDNH